MRGLGECKIAGHTFVVRELTSTQIIDEMQRLDDPDKPHNLDWLFAEKYLPLTTLEKIVEEDVGEFWEREGLSPSELEPLYQKAVEVNPFLARALRKKMEHVEAMAMMKTDSMLEGLSELFDGPSSFLPPEGTPDQENTGGHTSSKQ